MEIQRRGGPEEVPVREEIVEDAAGVISPAIVPTLVPVDGIQGGGYSELAMHLLKPEEGKEVA